MQSGRIRSSPRSRGSMPKRSAGILMYRQPLAGIELLLVHPGGPKILEAVAGALALPDDVLVHSRAILSQHGNMSSATVLFILSRMTRLASRRPIVAIGLGPGLMAEGMLLE